MNKEKAIEYALDKIPEILPLDSQDVMDLCNDILKNNQNLETIADAFLSILGQDDLTFQFISGFNAILNSKPESSPVALATAEPQGIALPSEETLFLGNEKFEERKGIDSNSSKTNTINDANTSPKLQQILNDDHKNTNTPSIAIKAQDTNSASGVISSTMDGRVNHKKQPSSTKPITNKQRKLQSLKEIVDVVNFLSMTQLDEGTNFSCTCQGKRHPIFIIAPNCLSCGKIICVKEGFKTSSCSFCHAPFLNSTERSSLIEALREEEKIINDSKSTNETSTRKQQTKTYKISSGVGKNLFAQQDKLFDYLERQKERERKREQVLQKESDRDTILTKHKGASTIDEEKADEDLIQAQKRLNKLLHFQETSAERTKVIDNASDFSMSTDIGLWGNARERAMLLKKQQRNLRKWEKLERERNGRRDKYVVSMDIGADGKVVMKEKFKNHGTVYANSDDDLEDISDLEDAEDLKEIQAHKDELSSTKESEQKQLQARIWDYEENQKQFKKAVYIESHQPDESLHSISDSTSFANEDGQKSIKQQMRSRVQINTHDNESLEANILAVL